MGVETQEQRLYRASPRRVHNILQRRHMAGQPMPPRDFPNGWGAANRRPARYINGERHAHYAVVTLPLDEIFSFRRLPLTTRNPDQHEMHHNTMMVI